MNQSRWERLSAIYHAALDQPADRRSAFLERACGGDSDLRADIDSLLRQELPSLPAFAVLAAETNAPAEAAVAPGTQIGIYRIERALGAGGMGEVHLATDTRLNRPVALKFVSGAADPDTRRRFQQETRAVSSLNHPHILTVHDSGQFAGRDYLVTEFVDGGTLKTWLDASPRTWRQTIELLIGVADALAAAHDAGILHRDVKPANILVAQNGYAKLADFGLAKLAGTPEQETRSEPRTGAGVVVGTIDYMSPEQLSGGSVDRRSDIFSFGVVLYETLCGRRPFAGATTVHVVDGILHQTPAPLAGGIPAPLRDIVAKALEKDPAERYQSMRDLVVDLRRVVRQTAEIPALRAASSPRRSWYVAAALAVLLAVAAAAGAWWRSDGPAIQSIAVVRLDNSLSSDPDLDNLIDGMVMDLAVRFAEVEALTVISPQSAMRFKGSTLPLADIAQELGVDAFLDVSVQRAGERVRVTATLIGGASGATLWTKQFNRDFVDLLGLQTELAQAIVGESRVQVGAEEAARIAAVPQTNTEAYKFYQHGRRQKERGDLAALDMAIGSFNKAIELDKHYAAAYAGLSWAWQSKLPLSPPAARGAMLTSAEQAAQKAVDLDPNLAEAHTALAGVRFEQWDWVGARNEYDKALDLNPISVDCGCYVWVLSAFGDGERAFKIASDVLRANPASMDALQAMGVVLLYNKHQYAEAERVLLEVQALEPSNALTAALLTTTYSAQKEWDKALSDKAAGHPAFRVFPAIRGRVLALKGETAAAEQILKDLPQSNHWGRAAIQLALGRKEMGFQTLRKAVEEHNPFARWLKVDPSFNDVRDDPRFQEIVALLKLPT